MYIFLLYVYYQILFMVIIQLTGNYNFFNLLTSVLCIAVFDDAHLRALTAQRPKGAADVYSTKWLEFI